MHKEEHYESANVWLVAIKTLESYSVYGLLIKLLSIEYQPLICFSYETTVIECTERRQGLLNITQDSLVAM